jgi:hypothetical protein
MAALWGEVASTSRVPTDDSAATAGPRTTTLLTLSLCLAVGTLRVVHADDIRDVRTGRHIDPENTRFR